MRSMLKRCHKLFINWIGILILKRKIKLIHLYYQYTMLNPYKFVEVTHKERQHNVCFLCQRVYLLKIRQRKESLNKRKFRRNVSIMAPPQIPFTKYAYLNSVSRSLYKDFNVLILNAMCGFTQGDCRICIHKNIRLCHACQLFINDIHVLLWRLSVTEVLPFQNIMTSVLLSFITLICGLDMRSDSDSLPNSSKPLAGKHKSR